jgi:hypothetical protein
MYPVPLSDAFWLDYAEPVSLFLETATLFTETLQNLDAEITRGADREGEPEERDRR